MELVSNLSTTEYSSVSTCMNNTSWMQNIDVLAHRYILRTRSVYGMAKNSLHSIHI
jgi:hypothetical protein